VGVFPPERRRPHGEPSPASRPTASQSAVLAGGIATGHAISPTSRRPCCSGPGQYQAPDHL